MPFITVHAGAKLTQEKKRELASALARVITVVPGKTADNLMLTIQDDLFMAFGDKDGRDCLHMNVRMYKQSAKQDKDRLVAECTELFAKTCALQPENIYITIEELENWGVEGRYI